MTVRVLVTGGAGFVGSNLALGIARAHPDWEVLALDNLKRRGSELSVARLGRGGVRFIHGDVRNAEDLEAAGPVSWLIECSAEASVHAGYDGNPNYLVNTNLVGAVNCLEHLRRHGGNLIFLSTSRVYPIAGLRALPLAVDGGERFRLSQGAEGVGWSERGISESFPLAGPRSLYGTTKLSAELIIGEYGALYGLKAVINRCGVLCGPWQMGKIDQGFVALWLARHVFGGALAYTGYDGAGHQVRDILHVADLHRLIEVEMAEIDRLRGGIYNVGGGRALSLSLRELTGYCAGLTGGKIDIGSDPKTRDADIPYYVTDNSAVTADTGWAPARSLDDTLADIHRWLCEHRTALEPLFAADGARA